MCCCQRTTRSITTCLCLFVAIAPAVASSQMRCVDGQACPPPAAPVDNHACCAPQPQHFEPVSTTRCVEVDLAPAPVTSERGGTPIPAHALVGSVATPPAAPTAPAPIAVAAVPADLPPPIHLGQLNLAPRGPPAVL
jgi:hypothetical protein